MSRVLLPFIHTCGPLSGAPTRFFSPSAGRIYDAQPRDTRRGCDVFNPSGQSCLITSAFSNKKKTPKGSPVFHIYLWRIAHSGPRLERPHWPRAITGRERDRRPARWTVDGGAGRKSTGSPFFKHRNHVLSSSYTTRRYERFKAELETKREKAAMTGF